jgi:hypothetical protein
VQQKRARRYPLQLPLHIILLGDQHVDRTELTMDISSGGVCFLSPAAVDVGERIEYLITLSGTNPPVRIRCLGNVLRSRSRSGSANGPYNVAVTMERYRFVQ